jgi:hypothetical protein
MADIFISYSKADHALALKLSAFLESEGWTVWWDKSLGVADLYRDEIMRQLVAARAVITVWTKNSVQSDWVRAEAGRAKADGKLIPVKTPELTYADIPLPFGEMHTENVGSTDLIRAAVVAQLAKPAVEPSAVTLLTKGFKWELLTWWGIIGGAVTLFTAISAMLKLADWARVLVENWKQWTHAFWVWAVGWLGIHLPPEWMPVLSFLFFWSLLTVGQAFRFSQIASKNQPIVDMYQDKSFWLISWRTFFCLIVMFLATSLWTGLSYPYVGILAMKVHIPPAVVMNPIAMFIPPQVIVVLFARHRLHAAVTTLLLLTFWTILTFNQLIPMNYSGDSGVSGVSGLSATLLSATLTAVALISVLPLILLSVAPAKAVSRRLIFLAIGLLLLIALNELSKLSPKLHEWGL